MPYNHVGVERPLVIDVEEATVSSRRCDRTMLGDIQRNVALGT